MFTRLNHSIASEPVSQQTIEKWIDTFFVSTHLCGTVAIFICMLKRQHEWISLACNTISRSSFTIPVARILNTVAVPIKAHLLIRSTFRQLIFAPLSLSSIFNSLLTPDVRAVIRLSLLRLKSPIHQYYKMLVIQLWQPFKTERIDINVYESNVLAPLCSQFVKKLFTIISHASPVIDVVAMVVAVQRKHCMHRKMAAEL